MMEGRKLVNTAGKKPLFLVFFFVFCSAFCFSQSIIGKWERSNEYGEKQVLIFYEGSFDMEIYSATGQRTSSYKQQTGMYIDYFAANNVLRFLSFGETGGGTGIYAEPMRFEYHIERNSLVLIALNPNARVSLLEGRYTKSR